MAIPVLDPAGVDAELIAALALALEATPEAAATRSALDDAVARAYGLSPDEGGSHPPPDEKGRLLPKEPAALVSKFTERRYGLLTIASAPRA